MKRILLVMSVAALMVAMIVATAMPAFARGPGTGGEKFCENANERGVIGQALSSSKAPMAGGSGGCIVIIDTED